jgi:release factor glutamine methyltransferase
VTDKAATDKAATDKPPRTIRELAAASRPWLEKRGVDNPRLDAELLIAHALGMKRVDLYMDWDRPLSDDEIARCRALIKRRGAREPVSLITGAREFWGLPFVVTKDTLAPRPETELLVELTLARIAADQEALFVDACTGTGCVAIALLKERPLLRAIATDISTAALDVARENARRNKVDDRFDARAGDLLSGAAVTEQVAFLVANPPYITDAERASLAPEVRDHEPALALFGEGADALGHHRRLLQQAAPLVAPGAFASFEIGAAQGPAARALVVDGWRCEGVAQDLASLDRVVTFVRT